MSPSDNTPGTNRYLGEGGTYEVNFSNTGGKPKIEVVPPDTEVDGNTSSVAA